MRWHGWKLLVTWVLVLAFGLLVWFRVIHWLHTVIITLEEPRVTWVGDRPTCPQGYQVASDEREAIAGKDSAHCTR